MKTLNLHIIALFLLLAQAVTAAADNNLEEHVQEFGDYQVHYSVFNSSFLTPKVAKAYGIVRSNTLAVMNISVLKKQKDGTYKGVEADVSGDQYDLIRRDPLDFQEVREQDAVYYLSTFEIQDRITIYFTVNVQVSPDEQPFKVEFTRMLYHDV